MKQWVMVTSILLMLAFSIPLSFTQTLVIESPLFVPDTRENRQLFEQLIQSTLGFLRSSQEKPFSQATWAGRTTTLDLDARNLATEPSGQRASRTVTTPSQYRLQTQFIDTGDSQVSMFTMVGPGNRTEQYVLLKHLPNVLSREVSQIILFLRAAVDRFPPPVFEAQTEVQTNEPPTIDRNFLSQPDSEIQVLTTRQITDPPEILDVLRISEIKIRDLPIIPTLMPTSLSIDGQGNLIVGAISLALQFDQELRLMGEVGSFLIDQGNFSPAYLATSSPAGTLFLRPAQGDDVFQFIPGIPRPRRISTGITIASAMTVLRDGSLVINDAMQNRTIRLQDGRLDQLQLLSGPYAGISTMKGGPDGNLWVFESVAGRVSILTPDGQLVDTIIPRIPQQDRMTIRALGIYEDGSFVAAGLNGLFGFTRQGQLLWRLDRLPTSPPTLLTGIMAIEVDSQQGYIYLTGAQDGRVFRLRDLSYQTRAGLSPTRDKEIALLLAQIRASRSARDLGRLAQFYQDRGALELAAQTWNLSLNQDPFFFEAEEALRRLELMSLTTQGDRAAARMDQDLRVFGIETARPTYQTALRLFEQALALDPSNPDVRQRIFRLQERFESLQSPSNRQNRPIQIDTAQISDLFPSLITVYQREPAGMLRITNTLDIPIERVRAQVRFANFMDLPVDSPGPDQLGPGETAEILLFVSLNQKTLELEENLPILTVVEAIYEIAGEIHSVQRTQGTTLLRRTALTWQDSRRLMAFVTPNEQQVNQFAFHLLNSWPTSPIQTSTPTPRASQPSSSTPGDRTTPGAGATTTDRATIVNHNTHGWRSFLASFPLVQRAVAITDGLGAFGIRYVEDPDSPITQILGSPTAIDTVRFPRDTLFYQSGDCDDTTALLASLLEAVGIQTAIMTSPGHVFLAFNTRIPADLSWAFQVGTLGTISYSGELWIPLETTVLDQGFYRVWEEAFRLYRTYEPRGDIEFLPLSRYRDLFPPLPLPRSSFNLPLPDNSGIQFLEQTYASSIVQTLFAEPTLQLETTLSPWLQQLPGPAATQTRNQFPQDRLSRRSTLIDLNKLGLLKDLFGQQERAEQVFLRALEFDRTFIPTVVHYSSLLSRTDRPQQALTFLDQTLARIESGAVRNLRDQIARRSTDQRLSQDQPSGSPGTATRASDAAGPLVPFVFFGD
jgi:tetratricopeptide (TPR) repeat protein